ncbi:DUF4221 family protein [Thermoflexibacter ruber]|uniref:DUF4221 domain-containing protein n=1 Tax=Thermoflexibacter ruber TaxID=1003 RepID=A0A1I2FVD2_9BACT|nr:DUF4221 family protein [Thermoflexibacter ruber]SFF08913.1 protein of unknown function [Thermoflexibacter ruber]
MKIQKTKYLIQFMFAKIVFFLITVLFYSCQQQAKEKLESTNTEWINLNSEQLFKLNNYFSEKQATLEQSEIINIPIDSVSLNYSLYPVYYDADTAHYYITANRNLHSLDFYDLSKKRLAKRIRFAKEGTDGVAGLSFFHIKNLDTLIFLPKNSKHAIITDLKGKVLKRTYIEIDDEDDLRHSMGAPLAFRDSMLIVSKMKIKPPMSLVGINTMCGINIHTGKVTEYGPRLPIAFKEKQAPVGKESPLFALVDNKINVRFGLLSVIYQYNMETEGMKVIPLKSKFQKQPITLSEYTDFVNMVHEVGEKQDYEKSSYQKLMYDPYREVFYSVFVEGIPLIDEKTGKKNDYEDRPISIIIADKDFRYLGEKYLGVGYFRNFLVTKDGLLVSNAHSKNPHYQEDVLSFTLFKLKYQE